MKIEIWSDVMCPFCYLGKHRLDEALKSYAEAASVEIEWKAFQLNPDLITDLNTDTFTYLSKVKGLSENQLRATTAHICQAGTVHGLDYRFEDVKMANTFRALQLIKYAAVHSLQHETEEALFKAYFTDGLNVDDIAVLCKLAAAVGLPTDGLAEGLETNRWADAVKNDLAEAAQLGIRSVPYFVFDRKLVVNGAQDVAVFLNALNKAGGHKGAAFSYVR